MARGKTSPEAQAAARAAVTAANQLVTDLERAPGDEEALALARSDARVALEAFSMTRDVDRVPWDVHSADEADDETRTAYRNAYEVYVAALEAQAGARAALEAEHDDVKAMYEFLSQPASNATADSTYRRTMAAIAL